MASSDPLIVAQVTQMGDAGKRVRVECREPSACMSGELYGYSGVLNEAIQRLEAIHQSAHALREEP